MKYFFLVLAVLLIGCHTNKHENKKSEVVKELWVCPMHPQIKDDHDSNCPICGMKLVKSEVKESPGSVGSDEHVTFSLSENRKQLIGVKTGRVVKKELFTKISAPGKVAFDPELFTAQSEYLEARKQYEELKEAPLKDVKESAKRMVESSKTRLKIMGLSDQQIGKITASSNLLINSKSDNIMIYAEVFEMDLPYISVGKKAIISSSAIEHGTIDGKVVSVDRIINPATRTARVRIEIKANDIFLRPESYVSVEILSSLGKQLTVPMDAILDSGKESLVFVVNGKGDYKPTKVVVAHTAGDEVAIAQGLSEGDEIVTSANFLIDSESRLQAALKNIEKGN